jgi:hypothetical protein
MEVGLNALNFQHATFIPASALHLASLKSFIVVLSSCNVPRETIWKLKKKRTTHSPE